MRFKSNYKEFDMNGYINKLKEVLNKNTVIVNIGTDKYIGDSVAPLVGTILKENNFKFPVYGTVEEPVHATNMERRLNEIKLKHPNAILLGIDACLGSDESIGEIQVRDYPISPGRGVGKNLPNVGTYSIVGIVDSSNIKVSFGDRIIRLDTVLGLARKISEGLIKASQYIEVNEVASDNEDNSIKLFKVS